MKWYNGVMSILTILCVGIVLFVLTGCANTADMKTAKIESEYRKQLRESVKNKPVRKNLTEGKLEQREVFVCDDYFKREGCEMETHTYITEPIGMPTEWMDQWPSLREDK
jgi:hypothetical protein